MKSIRNLQKMILMEMTLIFVKSGGVDLIKNSNADKQEVDKYTCGK